MQERARVSRHELGGMGANCYLVWSAASRQALVVDPGGEAGALLAEIRREGLTVALVVNTHGHLDHIAGNRELLRAAGGDLAIGAEDAGMLTDPAANLSLWLGEPCVSPPATRLLRHGDKLALGGMVFEVRATPGHTPGGLCLVGEGLAFTGDTLFAGGVGRTDLPGGDEEALYASIREQLLTLPDTVRVLPGHGEESTIGAERAGNPFLC